MNDTLRRELNQIAVRERDLRRVVWLSAGWLALAGAGVVMVIYTHWHGEAISLKAIALWVLAAAVWFGVVHLVTRRMRSPLAVARRLEARFPELDARLVTAVEQTPDPDTGRLNLFQQQVVAETLDHGRRERWANVLPAWAAVASVWAPRLAIAGLILVFGLMTTLGPRRADPSEQASAVATGEVRVEPGNTSVERNTSLLVLARFGGQLPGDVQLLSKTKAGETKTLAMSKSLDDPVFAARVPDVKEDLQYAVRFGQEQSAWFDAKVFDYPELKRADADLKYPGYTRLAERHAEDVRTITAVEGTSATFTLHLNKPVAEAELRPANGDPILLQPDPARPGVVTARLTLKQSQTFKLKLTDADGRSNKEPATELAINVNPNRPAEIKPVTPGRDVDVSPIQELTTGAGVFDDFGLVKVGITYGIAGRPTQDVTLASDAPGGKKIDVRQLLSMEQIQAKPDELLTYHFWAEDFAADGSVRRTAGDMYFAEVRPFEEIFRQGEQPSEGQQRQQQQQQGGQGQQAEQLAELQKQIIAATWKIIRRGTGTSPSDAFAPDVKLVRESQASARERAAAMEEELTDARSRGYLKSVLEFMDRAVAGLEAAEKSKSPAALQPALGDEQSAYQALLRLRAREFEVTRGNQQQQGSSSSSSSRRQQQLDQMQLNQEENRYQTQRSATPPNESPQQRETRQILNRLKELAQRQEDLNRQMQELKSALEQTRDEKQKEELQRQLARLRDQQEQQLRDTDELRDRMERPENQESMAEARQQLENTRENVRRASEQLQQQQVSDAAASGARAGEQLNQLRDQVGRESAGQLKQAMTDMRQAARDLDDKQKQLSEQMTKLDAERKPSLRQGDQRRDVAEQLDQQKQKLEQLTEAMRKTVEESESSQPLVSKQLYDTLRQNSQRQTTEALDASRQLLDRGFTNEARQAEAEAAMGITKLREGVEQAATGVLGDEAEALRRARAELDRLTDDLQREVDRNNPGGRAAAATRPSGRGLAAGASTRPAGDGRLASNTTTRPSGRTERGENRQASTQPASTRPAGQLALADPGERGQSPSRDQQPGQQGEPNSNANDGPSAQRQNASGNSEQNQSGQPNRQTGERGNSNTGGNRPEDAANQNGQGPQAGQSGNETQREQGNRQSNAGQQPGQRDSTGQRQPGQSGERSQPQPNQRGQQSGQGQPSAEGQQADERQQPGQSQQPGEGQQSGQAPQPGGGQQPGTSQQPSQNANNPPRQPGLRGQSGQGQGRGTSPGEQPQDDAQPRDSRPNDPRENNNQGRGGNGSTNTAGREDAFTGDNDNPAGGPLTGDNFQAWSDRLRDVEEMVTDPKLRQRAASIRERARELRAEMKRHSKQPNWDVVQNTVGTPLAELRDEVALELLRKQSPDALVPLDKDNVPPQYAEQVKRYYERLGAGR